MRQPKPFRSLFSHIASWPRAIAKRAAQLEGEDIPSILVLAVLVSLGLAIIILPIVLTNGALLAAAAAILLAVGGLRMWGHTMLLDEAEEEEERRQQGRNY